VGERTLFEMSHALIGCDWGRAIMLPDNRHPCAKRATRRIALYQDGQIHAVVKVCDEHAELVDEQTNPREGGRG
jgi:hypothetical protein